MSTAIRRPSTENIAINSAGTKLSRPSTEQGTGTSSAPRAAFIQTSALGNRPYFRVENSYRLEPEVPFSSANVRKVIKRVLDTELKGVKYDSSTSNMAGKLADSIKKGVKDLGYTRYKIVAMVGLGQPRLASVALASRCVWNHNVDTYSEYVHNGDEIYAFGLVYGIYSE